MSSVEDRSSEHALKVGGLVYGFGKIILVTSKSLSGETFNGTVVYSTLPNEPIGYEGDGWLSISFRTLSLWGDS